MYEKYYARYFLEIEHIKYKKLTSVQLQAIFDKIESDSPYIAIICMKMWKSATNNAIKKRVISINKFNDIDAIKKPNAQHYHLTIEKTKEILELAKNGLKGFEKQRKKYYTMLYTFIGTGMRAGEVLALSPEDFDYATKTIIVNKQFTKGELKETKTYTSNRKVYIFQELADVIEDYKKDVKGKILFPSETGGYMSLRNFGERYWKRLKESAGITERVRIHDLRGSYIDMLLSSGLSPKFAQNQVGHAKTQTTLDVYAQNNTDMVKVATNKIDEIFKSGGKTVEKSQEVEKTKIISFLDERRKRTKKEPFGS
jgi:integrase